MSKSAIMKTLLLMLFFNAFPRSNGFSIHAWRSVANLSEPVQGVVTS